MWVGLLCCPRPMEAGTLCRLDLEGAHLVGVLLANLAHLFITDSERYLMLNNSINNTSMFMYQEGGGVPKLITNQYQLNVHVIYSAH